MRQSARAGSLRNAQTLIDGESDLLFFQKLFDPGGRELAVAAYDSKALGLEFSCNSCRCGMLAMQGGQLMPQYSKIPLSLSGRKL